MFRHAATVTLLLASSAPLAADQRIAADLDGDGQPDSALLTQTAERLRLSLKLSAAPQSVAAVEFGVDPARQDAVCRLPVRITAEPLDCEPDGVSLPGCKQQPPASELVIEDGDCDAIRIYWNHEKGALSWWRR